MAFDVRAQGAFLGLGAGGLVVGGLVGRHQQRGERVDDRRLAGADVTGQQRGLGAGSEPPDLGVERAPVQDLRVLQPVAGPSAITEFDRGEELLHSSPATAPAYSRSFAAKSDRVWAST